MRNRVIGNSGSSGRRYGMLYAAGAAIVLMTIALVILNGCGGGSSSSTPALPPPPSGSPSVVVGAVVPCTADFYSNSAVPAVCQTATVTNCPNVSDLGFTYSYDTPGSPKGTIVFLSGAGGTVDTGDVDFAGFYFANGYEVIQVEWANDWEYTGGNGTNTFPANVRLAACRGATLLNFIFNTNNSTLYSGGGRCAEGSSAGSGAIAYALTFYGAGSYLDAVEMKSGPPIADFEQGCEEPPPNPVTICPAGQFGCQLGGTQPWVLSPTYTGAASGVRNWTGDSSCAVANTTTSAASNAAWLQQSIVNDGTGSPTYSYPKTAMTAWLCQNLFQGNTCVGGQGGTPQDYCPNNSTSQAQIYYAKLTSDPNSLPQSSYKIYAVQNCDGPEGVAGTDPTVAALGGVNGTAAIENDMLAQCVKH